MINWPFSWSSQSSDCLNCCHVSCEAKVSCAFRSFLALLAWPWTSPTKHCLYTLLSTPSWCISPSSLFQGLFTNAHVAFFVMLSYITSIISFHVESDMASSIEVGSLTEPMMSTIIAMLTMWSEVFPCSSSLLNLHNLSVRIPRNSTLGVHHQRFLNPLRYFLCMWH